VLTEQAGGSGFGARDMPGDTRAGSKAAMAAVAKACRKVSLPSETATTGSASGASSTSTAAAAAGTALYDCQGRASALSNA